ncbi:hypothetical protein Q9966_011406 [Columba livia]|nr:hypothetical protein Q9966_011406 [Columba livia]
MCGQWCPVLRTGIPRGVQELPSPRHCTASGQQARVAEAGEPVLTSPHDTAEVPVLPVFQYFPCLTSLGVSWSATCLLPKTPQDFSWSLLHCCWCCQELKPWTQEIRSPSYWASLSVSSDSVPALACMQGKGTDCNDFQEDDQMK